jgi:glyoxylase I family protein
MANQITTGAFHHLTLTVTDIQRSQEFYTSLLGFRKVRDLPQRVILSNGSTLLGLSIAPIPERAINGDSFDECRVGLDHLSFSVSSRNDLEQAVRILEERGVSHGKITDLGPDFGLYVLCFRDPDNIQLELTATYG